MIDRTRLVAAVAVAAGVAAAIVVTIPSAWADLTPIVWDGGPDAGTHRTSDPASWNPDVAPAVDGSDTLVFPDATNFHSVIYDSVLIDPVDGAVAAEFEAFVFEDEGYLMTRDITTLPPRLFGDFERREGFEKQLILAEAAGVTQLDLPINLDPQENPGHITAAQAGTIINCLPALPDDACYDVMSGTVVLDGPGTHRLFGPIYGDETTTTIVAEGRTIVAGTHIGTFDTKVDGSGTLQLGEPGSADDNFGTVAGLLLVGGDGRLEGNGNLAECECLGVMVVGVAGEDPLGPGTLSPGFATSSPADAIGFYAVGSAQLGDEGTFEVDWSPIPGNDDAACDQLLTEFLELGNDDGDADQPVLELRLPAEDIAAGAHCTIADGQGFGEGSGPAVGIFEDPSGTDLPQDAVFLVPSAFAHNGVEAFRISYTEGEDGQDIALTNVPTVAMTAAGGTEGFPLQRGFSLSDSPDALGEDGGLTITIDDTGGTADAGPDYADGVLVVDVNAASTSGGGPVDTVQDTVDEPDETVTFTMSLAYGDSWSVDQYVVVFGNERTVAILDDDEVVTQPTPTTAPPTTAPPTTAPPTTAPPTTAPPTTAPPPTAPPASVLPGSATPTPGGQPVSTLPRTGSRHERPLVSGLAFLISGTAALLLGRAELLGLRRSPGRRRGDIRPSDSGGGRR